MKALKALVLIILLWMVCSESGHAQEKKEFKFDNGTVAYWVGSGDEWGVEDAKGKTIVPKIYGKMWCFGNTIYCKNRKNYENKHACALYDYNGNCKISEEDGYGLGLNFVRWNGKWIAYHSEKKTVFDENGDMIFKYQQFNDAEGFYYLKNELTDEIIVSSGNYTDYFVLHGDYISTQNNKKQGVINLDGSVVIPANTYGCIFSDGDAHAPYGKGIIKGFKVWLNSKDQGYQGYYDRKGNLLFPADKYTEITMMNNGMFSIVENGRAGVADSLGNVRFMTNYQKIYLKKDKTTGELYYEMWIGDSKGRMSLDGDVVEEPKLAVKENVIKKDHLNDTKYIEVSDVNGLVGAKDTLGRVILPCEYDRVWNSGFENVGLVGFRLYKNGYEGFADNAGKIIIPLNKYQVISDVYGGREYLVVEINGRKGLCDTKGHEVIKPIYDNIEVWEGTIIATVGEMKGVVGKDGSLIVPFQYTKIYNESALSSDLNERKPTGNYRVELFGKKGICGKDGSILVPPRYTEVHYDNSNSELYGKPVYTVKDGEFEGLYADGKMIFPSSLFKHVILCKREEIETRFTNEWYIKAYNEYKDKICYFDLNGTLIYDSDKDNLFKDYFTQGAAEFDKQNYKKAVEYYKKAVNVRRDGRAYYNIGVAYYNMGQYKDAIKNLKLCKEIKDSQYITDKATDLIIDCEFCLQKKRERNVAVWVDLLGSALTAATTVTLTNTAISSYNANIRAGGDNRGNLDYLLDPRYAMMQVEQQNWNEYLQMTNGGTTMTYQEYMAIKAQAYMESQGQGSYSDSDGSGNKQNASYSTTSSGSNMKDCSFCDHSGKCKTCNGKRWYWGIAGAKITCPNCTDGRCTHCGGTGKLSH